MTSMSEFEDLLDERILVLDGAMGTMLQNMDLSPNDFGGQHYEGCNEHLILSAPHIVSQVHTRYLEAGADIIETNTFGATSLVLAEYNLESLTKRINEEAAKLAKSLANQFSTAQKPRFVAGSVGPTTRAISVTGGVSFQELCHNFYEQTLGLLAGGVDFILVETAQDTRNIKAALLGVRQAFDAYGRHLPIWVSGTIEPTGSMLAGQTAEALAVSLAPLGLQGLGLNCATGPEFMTDHLRTLHELTSGYLACYPNAGLPNEDGLYLETPETLARSLELFAHRGWLNIVGGCCGTTDAHIRQLVAMVEDKQPRVPPKPKTRWLFSGIDVVEVDQQSRPLLVGERTNVIGSRKFKELIDAEAWDEASEIARKQVKKGAHIIDVCLQTTDRDELNDIDHFYSELIRKIKVPLMIDTTNPKALDKSLTYIQGKSIINSINLEEGEKRFMEVVPLAKKMGAALVVGTIDEDPVQAQAFLRERKLAIAERSFKLLTESYGIPAHDIIFDPLVFPCATGDENYIGGAVETLESLRLIKARLPSTLTILGISNVSFGIPALAREVVNSVFLYHATIAGLDLAIVNTEKLERFAKIANEERQLAENLLFNWASQTLPENLALHEKFLGWDEDNTWRSQQPRDWREQSREARIRINQENITLITEFYRITQKKTKAEVLHTDPDTLLAQAIIEGSKEGLFDLLDKKLQAGFKPLEIINGALMKGMNEVGRLFNNNELIVAEVLQSAEVMKAAVAYLEPHMEVNESSKRGRILLATVKGDVHDIGKNLVDIILSNNGFEVINLGIKIPPEEIIRAYREHNPDIIGLSGLLVKSAQQMVATVADLKQAGINAPILVGGAALSEAFTQKRIAPEYASLVLYAQDAMTGLKLANLIMDPETRTTLEHQHNTAAFTAEVRASKDVYPELRLKSAEVCSSLPARACPYGERKQQVIFNAEEIFSYINPQMLYVRHLGFRGNYLKKLADRDEKALKLRDLVEQAWDRLKPVVQLKALWQFFEAEPHGNTIHVYHKGGTTPEHSFQFHRQRRPEGLCLSDYVLAPDYLPSGTMQRDSLAMFVVTAGSGIREMAEEFKHKGEFFLSHAISALALELAEGAAEWLHRKIREDWGLPDPAHMTMMERYQAKYRGKRYSFGYPACPNLEHQLGLWKLLKPQSIGVELTEGLMMDPEATVSALVFHHADCKYFGVGLDNTEAY